MSKKMISANKIILIDDNDNAGECIVCKSPATMDIKYGTERNANLMRLCSGCANKMAIVMMAVSNGLQSQAKIGV